MKKNSELSLRLKGSSKRLSGINVMTESPKLLLVLTLKQLCLSIKFF